MYLLISWWLNCIKLCKVLNQGIERFHLAFLLLHNRSTEEVQNLIENCDDYSLLLIYNHTNLHTITKLINKSNMHKKKNDWPQTVDHEYYSLHKIWLSQWKTKKVTKKEKKIWLNCWFHEHNILWVIAPVRVQRWLLVVGGRVHHVPRGGVCRALARSSFIWCLLLSWRWPFGGLLTHSVFCKMLKYRKRWTCRGYR